MYEFCINLLAIERETEKLRNQLAECHDFEPFSVYRWIDIHKEGWITPRMLQKYCFNEITNEEWKRIIESISKTKITAAMNYKEFYNYVMPNVNKRLRLQALSREQKFIDPQLMEKRLITDQQIKNYAEVFTERLIHRQSKIHSTIKILFLQGLKLQNLLNMK